MTLNMAQVLDVAVSAARAAGSLMLSERESTKQIKTKSSDVDLVTHVDLACDALIRGEISRAFPEHQLLTEETFQSSGFDALDWSQPVWIIDPIDGTTNYAHGFPHSAVSIACCVDAKPVVGVIFDPFKNELFQASTGGGCRLNDKPVQVSDTDTLSKALLATGFAFRRDEHADAEAESLLAELLALLNHCRDVRRAGSAALDLAYVACGRLDGFYEYSLAPWDVAAGILLVQEAGGALADIRTQQPLTLRQMKQDILATTPAIQSAFQQLLGRTARASCV